MKAMQIFLQKMLPLQFAKMICGHCEGPSLPSSASTQPETGSQFQCARRKYLYGQDSSGTHWGTNVCKVTYLTRTN
jgi:hypothetical protein